MIGMVSPDNHTAVSVVGTAAATALMSSTASTTRFDLVGELASVGSAASVAITES